MRMIIRTCGSRTPHIIRCANEGVGKVCRLHGLGQPEVAELDHAGGGDEDVLQL